MLRDGREVKEKDLALSGPATEYFWLLRDRLELSEGVLYYNWESNVGSGRRLVVPKTLRDKVLHYHHDLKSSAHPGIKNTIDRVKRGNIWHGMTGDCEPYVTSCSTCNKQKKPRVKAKAALGEFHAGAPMERVHVDILGPFPLSQKGNQYVLVLIDQFTKWVECWALPNQTAEMVAKTMVEQFISRFGCPFQIHTDQGRQFEGGLFQAVCKILEITKTRTTPYRPCSNGQVERINRTQMIRCYIDEDQSTWDEYIPLLAGAIRSTKNRQTGFSPNMMMLGREVSTPWDILVGQGGSSSGTTSVGFVENVRSRLERVHQQARDSLGAALMRQKRDYDLRLESRTYSLGDLVYLLNPAPKVGETKKLIPVWKGPFLISEVLASTLYRIQGKKGLV